MPGRHGVVRYGVLGCGGIARQILPEVMQSRRIKVVAAAAADPARARAFAKKFSLEAEGSYDTLLARPDIDAVYVALPESLHAPWSIAAARAGKHVLCEKTLAPSLKEVLEMLKAARRNHVRLLEAFMWRFSEGAAVLERESRRLGRIRSVHAHFGFNLDDQANYRNFKEFGGGCLNDIGGYALSAVRLLLGEPQRVQARLLHKPREVRDADFHGAAWLEFKDGGLATMEFSFSEAFSQGVQVIGEKGRLYFPTPFVREKKHELSISLDGKTKVLRLAADPRYRLMFEAFGAEIARQPKKHGLFEAEAHFQALAMQALRLSAVSGKPENP